MALNKLKYSLALLVLLVLKRTGNAWLFDSRFRFDWLSCTLTISFYTITKNKNTALQSRCTKIALQKPPTKALKNYYTHSYEATDITPDDRNLQKIHVYAKLTK
jgi:hypothetical protein